MLPTITVAIVTRNRSKELEECLLSLLNQTKIPSKIIIVNNNSTDDTHKVINRYSKKLNIREVLEKETGYPNVYNRALNEAHTRWLAFIDDDCVADKDWYMNCLHSIEKFKNCAAIAGYSNNYYSRNWCACSFQFWSEYWRNRSVTNTQVNDYRTLDSRNIIYNKFLLRKHKIKFDNTFISGAEDGELGLQIQKKQLQAVVVNQMIIYHKEPTDLKTFLRKKINYAKASTHLNEKWPIHVLPSHKNTQLKMMINIFNSATGNLNYFNRLQSLLLITVDYFLSRYNIYNLINS